MKNFVLKDRDGRMGGYLQLHRGTVRCRLMDAGIEAELMLFGPQNRSLHIEPGGREQCFSYAGEQISGAVVADGEWLCLSTDEASVYEFERTQQQKRRRTGKQTGLAEQRTEQLEAEHPAHDAHDCHEKPWPQRRWPRPVCWPSAVYDHGQWKEK